MACRETAYPHNIFVKGDMKHKLDATRGRILVIFESTSGLRGLDSSHVKENLGAHMTTVLAFPCTNCGIDVSNEPKEPPSSTVSLTPESLPRLARNAIASHARPRKFAYATRHAVQSLVLVG